MRWEDERWVKVYTRDTTDWLALSFDAQALFLMLLRKVDRAGNLPLGKHGKRGAAVIVGHAQSWDRLAPALEELLTDGCVLVADGILTIPTFALAQEARASDKARQAKAREVASVTPRDAASHNVTECHTPSHPVTSGHAASHAVTPRLEETRSDESREERSSASQDSAGAVSARDPLVLDGQQPEKPAKRPTKAKAPREPQGDPRHRPLADALVAAGYPFHRGRSAKAVSDLLALADQREGSRGEAAHAEIMRRARIGWAWVGFPSCRSIPELAAHWGHYEHEQQARGHGPPDVRRGGVRAELMDHNAPQEPF